MSSASDSDLVIASAAVQSEESRCSFSLAEIQRATNNFHDALVIGVGGFGKVYKGFIDDGSTAVAIKRLKSESEQGAREFWTEVKMLSKLRHPHLVALIGYCNESDEMILVYEYMAYGTLAHHLYESSRKERGTVISHLWWEKRLDICVGAARGLDYLHNGTDQYFIHRDVKTTNILLDDNLVAKISDFGLSKGSISQSETHVSTDVKGTFGYLDPDYFSTGRLTKKSDVYAFGVVLFEVLCGRPPVFEGLGEERINLVSWAQECIKKGKLGLIIHPSLSGQISPSCLKYFLKIVNSCVRIDPRERPTMAEVVQSLEFVLASQRKICTEGITTKVLRGIGLVPKGGSPSEPISNSESRLLLRLFSHTEIRAATNDFDDCHLIGCYVRKNKYEGSIRNNIYKGCIDGGILVAIKRLHGLTERELSQVKAAIEVLKTHVCQPHMVALIGFCFTKHEAFLVYEYMANGSLEDHLYGEYNEQLPWRERLEICIDVARVLQSLCEETTGVLHINIKPHHILLDEKWTAKIPDFALSKLFPADIGRYIAFYFTCFYQYPSRDPDTGIYEWSESCPELIDFMYSKTHQTYVYSFGVLLLEVLCANEPLAFRDCDPESLVRRCERSFRWGPTDQLLNRRVFRTIAPECLIEFVKIASSCVLDENQQPSLMNNVLARLQFALQLQEAWENRQEISVL